MHFLCFKFILSIVIASTTTTYFFVVKYNFSCSSLKLMVICAIYVFVRLCFTKIVFFFFFENKNNIYCLINLLLSDHNIYQVIQRQLCVLFIIIIDIIFIIKIGIQICICSHFLFVVHLFHVPFKQYKMRESYKKVILSLGILLTFKLNMSHKTFTAQIAFIIGLTAVDAFV